ncbi:MAG TPA: TonB-dependent receptor, partial [Allosphingosinicella sp.]|nr:TonB-dependent receptor [Allosphingosinicella sp.]
PQTPPAPAAVEPEPKPQPADPAAAEQEPAQGEPGEPTAEAEADIVVTGQRLRGAVEGDIPPEVTLDAAELRAFGANTIAELITALAPQTSSGRGRGGGFPIILVNGRRISGFSEIRDLPPEAIERVDILPEEVALRYGYRAEQRVVNLVLRERFNAVTAEVEGGLATAGGRGVSEIDVNYLTIQGPTRTSFDVEYQNNAALLESERDIIQTRVGPPGVDIGDFRTLLPETEQVILGGTHSRMFGSVGATFDGRFVNSSSASLLGLPTDDPASRTALGRESETWSGRLGMAMNGTIRPWRWNFTAALDRVETDSVTERLALAPADTAEQVNQAATANLLASGPLLQGWAGPLNATFNASGELRSFESQSTRSGLFRETSLSRERAEAQASFDLPVTSTREDVFDAVGDLSLNLNLNAEYLSDFGALTTIGYGLNWRPIDEVSVIASFTQEEGAPGIQQLGEPVIATPNVRIFDFVRGETVDITRIDGGNPALIADNRRVINLGVNV